MNLDEEYWNNRYKAGETQWDSGSPNLPLKTYIDNALADKKIKILIPGCGNAYEARYLFDQGYKNTWVIDIAELPLKNFRKENPNFPKDQILHQDFFKLEQKFDLVLEQTFFCALDPVMRKDYAIKMAEIIVPGGKLAGVLFNTTFENSPPFGGSKEEYAILFSPYFEFRHFEECYNSIKPRAGRELFIEFIRK